MGLPPVMQHAGSTVADMLQVNIQCNIPGHMTFVGLDYYILYVHIIIIIM